EINENGGDTLAIRCNVLDIESIKKAKEEVDRYFGGCDILINGAGGNSPKATTDNEYHELNILNGIKSFFDLEKEG
ncbi:SDR family NAD(P)-dependent oxidoreductase, partial [Streptobacillus moniliformis]